jgi:hypothetical protein
MGAGLIWSRQTHHMTLVPTGGEHPFVFLLEPPHSLLSERGETAKSEW